MPLFLKRPHFGLPQGKTGPSPYWLSRGLKSLYILDAGRWQINQVTGLVGGAVVGTGPTFPGGWLRTPGVANNGASLEHGLSTDIALPITLVVGWRRISGSVSWSLLDNISAWTGWYGAEGGTFAISNNNSFDGSLTLGGNVSAFCHAAANNLYGASSGGGVATDTAVAAPANVTPSTVALGWSRRGLGSNDNPAVAEFTFFAAIQGAVSIGELSELVYNPGLLFELRRILFPVSTGGATTVALSGISATFAQTAPTISSTIPLVGESATASAGTLLPAFSFTLLGQAGAASAGILNPSTSRVLSGQSATFSAGSVIPSVAIVVIGLQATFSPGTLTASSSGGDTAALVGEVVTFAQTAPSVSVTIALTGIAATMAAGILSASSGTATITVKAGSWLRYKKLQ